MRTSLAAPSFIPFHILERVLLGSGAWNALEKAASTRQAKRRRQINESLFFAADG